MFVRSKNNSKRWYYPAFDKIKRIGYASLKQKNGDLIVCRYDTRVKGFRLCPTDVWRFPHSPISCYTHIHGKNFLPFYVEDHAIKLLLKQL